MMPLADRDMLNTVILLAVILKFKVAFCTKSVTIINNALNGYLDTEHMGLDSKTDPSQADAFLTY
jgi:hypothetical protein